MKKINLKANLTIGLTIFLFLLPLISSITIIRENPQINVELPENINISQAEIFDGMIVNYTFDMGIPVNTGFTYEHDSGNIFNVTWWYVTGSSRWAEDETTRLTSMSSGPSSFGDGVHTPVWIFTNVSLYDLVPIAVASLGDHIFNITKEKIFNIPGFGSVEVWQLEDLSSPGGIAWYEKSTGILIKGNFVHGMLSYTLEFFNTNAVFSNVAPVSGLFDGLYMTYEMPSTILLTANVSYAGYSINTYNTSWEIISLATGHWTVDTTTRHMSNVNVSAPHFLPGIYSPFWIFTNVSLGTNVSIAVDSEGDHIFEVKNSINSEFPGFGPISIWELEDLDGNGGVAWYEKNSGILLNATFVFGGGASNYSFNLVDTNAIFGYLIPYSFSLSTNATDPDLYGIFDLEWTNSEFAKNYSIYEHSSVITEFNNSLTPITLETTNMIHHLSGYTTGDYYFIAVAKNDFGLTLSNIVKITVDIPSSGVGGGGIPGYNIFFFIIAGLSISIIMLRKWKTLRKLK